MSRPKEDDSAKRAFNAFLDDKPKLPCGIPADGPCGLAKHIVRAYNQALRWQEVLPLVREAIANGTIVRVNRQGRYAYFPKQFAPAM